MSEIKVLIEIQGGVCQTVFVQTDGFPEEDVKVGIIDWDVLDTADPGLWPDEKIGWLAGHDDETYMTQNAAQLGKRIFEDNPMTILEYQAWRRSSDHTRISGVETKTDL
jgi:hypothetical protein